MRNFGEFLKTTITGGLLVLFPLFGCIFLIVKTAEFLSSFIKPILTFMPPSSYFGVALADAASVVILLLLCFIVGLIVKTSIGLALAGRLSQILNTIPGFKMLMSISRIVFDREDASGTPVLVQRGENKQIGFMMEETGAEELTIFFPDAPGLFSGTVEIVKTSKVQKLNVSTAQAARVIATFGTGTSTLLANQGLNHKDTKTQSS